MMFDTAFPDTDSMQGLSSNVKREKIVYIVGMDTYLGCHFAKHWFEHGYRVIGCGERD